MALCKCVHCDGGSMSVTQRSLGATAVASVGGFVLILLGLAVLLFALATATETIFQQQVAISEATNGIVLIVGGLIIGLNRTKECVLACNSCGACVPCVPPREPYLWSLIMLILVMAVIAGVLVELLHSASFSAFVGHLLKRG